MADVLKCVDPSAEAGGELLHQLLHGYSDGHRLLQSSLKVPEDLTRLLLRMSDLSGSNRISGFEEYITGYPLTSMDAYALGKTWYAPEMPRPGCVWTHTIIIPASAMWRIAALGLFRTLFKRPNRQLKMEAYANPISLSQVVGEGSQIEPPTIAGGDMPSLLALHYAKDERPVLLPARDSREFEDLLFAMWSQKWPALRMALTFSTRLIVSS